MDLTWLASSFEAVAMAAITCLVWFMLQKPDEPHQTEASDPIEADAGDLVEKRCRSFSELLTHPNHPRVFIGS